MPFVFLLLFALVCLQTTWPRWFEWPTPLGCAILVGTIVITSWLSAWLIAKAIAWQMTRHPDQRASLLRRYARWRRWHFICLLSSFLGALYLLSWGDVLSQWWVSSVPEFLRSNGNLPGFQIGLLAPFFIGLLAAWERFFGVEKTAYELAHPYDRFLTRWQYLLMQVRHQFFLVLPPILLMSILQVLDLFFEDDHSDVLAFIMIGIMGAALVLMPVMLRLFLGLRPLPPGRLRSRLEFTARRLGFRFSDVLVWNTRHLMANALVTGFVPWVRYVVLTDRLIDDLSDDEIEAVFGHEVGHIKHHHLFFYLAFFLTSFILISVFWNQVKGVATEMEIKDWLSATLGEDDGSNTWDMLKGFIKIAILGGYTLLCFGFISRRCERQADLFGAHTVSTEVFIAALEKVAVTNGIPRDRSGNWLMSWQHPTIAQRVDFLQAMQDNPARIPQFHLSIFLLKWSFFLALAFLIIWFEPKGVWALLKEF